MVPFQGRRAFILGVGYLYLGKASNLAIYLSVWNHQLGFIVCHMRIYKKPRPFRHLFVADRILRAWYRGIKNAGSRKRAQGRAQDIPYHHTIYTYKYHVLYMYLIDYLYHILPFCLARWSLLRSVEAFVFKKCPACSLVMWHVEWRIVPSGVSIGRRMLAFCFFLPRKPTI